MKRVLLLHQNFVGAGEAGNARALHLIEALEERGFLVELLCTNESYLGDCRERAESAEHDGGLTIRRFDGASRRSGLRRRSGSYLSFAWKCLQALPTLPPIDLVYATSPPLPQVFTSMLAAEFWRCPMVLEVRDLWPAFLEEGGLLRSPALILAARALEMAAYHNAVHVVVTSPGFAPYLEAMGVPPEAITVAPTGVDPKLAAADPSLGSTWRERNGVADRTLVLYAGSFNEAYGIDRLIEAAAKLAPALPAVDWLFAGNGRARAAVERAAQEQPNVRYLGSLPKGELIPVLLAADIGVNTHAAWPLLDTTLTGKLFDYMAVGLPIVSVRGGQMGLLIERAGAGLVAESPSADGLCGAIHRLAQMSRADRRAMGARARAWALSRVAAPASAKKIVDVLERTLEAAPRRRRGTVLRSSLAAARNVATSCDRRARKALYGDCKEATLQAAFDRWLPFEEQRRSGPP